MNRLIALSLLVAACAPVTGYVPLNSSPRPLAPRPVAEVELFTTTAPTREYVEVALLTASPAPNLYWQYGVPAQEPATLIENLRARGARLGCDGLIVRPGSGYSYQGTCVVFR